MKNKVLLWVLEDNHRARKCIKMCFFIPASYTSCMISWIGDGLVGKARMSKGGCYETVDKAADSCANTVKLLHVFITVSLLEQICFYHTGLLPFCIGMQLSAVYIYTALF